MPETHVWQETRNRREHNNSADICGMCLPCLKANLHQAVSESSDNSTQTQTLHTLAIQNHSHTQRQPYFPEPQTLITQDREKIKVLFVDLKTFNYW